MCYRILARILARLNEIDKEIRRLRFIVDRPRSLRFVLQEFGDMISFAVQLPVPPEVASDWAEIASGELSVIIGDAEPIVLTTTKEQQLTPDRLVSDDRFKGPQGTFVRGEFLYIDDAGNRGESRFADTVLADTVPPVAPAQFGFVMTGEESDVVPEPPTPDA